MDASRQQILSSHAPELSTERFSERLQSKVDLRTEVLNSIELPLALPLLNKTGSKISKELQSLLEALHPQLLETIPKNGRQTRAPDGWENAKGGVPENTQDFTAWVQNFPARFARLDPFSQALAIEVFTLADEVHRNGDFFAGQKLFPHQKALFSWFAMALVSSRYGERSESVNRTFLIDSPHGTGKTKILGMINLCGLRANIRNHSKHVTTYVTSRGFSNAQQVVGLENLSRMVTHSYPDRFTEKDLNEMLRYYARKNPTVSSMLTPSVWNDFLTNHGDGFDTQENARSAIEKYLNSKKQLTHQDQVNHIKPIIEQLSLWFSHQAALIRQDNSGNMMLLRFPAPEPANREAQTNSKQYCGDVVNGFPDEVISSGLIYSPRFPDSLLARHAGKRGAPVDADEVNARVVLGVFCENDTFAYTNRNPLHAEVFNQSALILVDEASKKAAHERQSIAPDPNIIPIVVGVTFTKSRWHVGMSYDAISPQPSIVKAFEQGILPGLAEAIYPPKDTPHVPFESQQGIDQIVNAHFNEYPLYDKLGLQQPYYGRTVVVVPKAHVGTVTKALQNEYDNRGISGVVVPLSANMGKSAHDRYMGRLLAWMVAWKGYSAAGERPPFAQILVTHPAAVIDGLDLPDVNVTIADPKSTSHDSIVRLAMRAARGHVPQEPNSGYRGLVVLHRFFGNENTNRATFSATPSSTLVPDFDLKTARHNAFIEGVPGAVVLPAPLAKKELLAASRAKIKPQHSPFGTGAIEDLSLARGVSPINEDIVDKYEDPSLENRSPLSDERIFARRAPETIPLRISASSVENPMLLNLFENFCRTLEGDAAQWDDVTHATNRAARLLPPPWKPLWEANDRGNREGVRSHAYNLNDSYRLNSTDFARRLAEEVAIRIGAVKPKKSS